MLILTNQGAFINVCVKMSIEWGQNVDGPAEIHQNQRKRIELMKKKQKTNIGKGMDFHLEIFHFTRAFNVRSTLIIKKRENEKEKNEYIFEFSSFFDNNFFVCVPVQRK